MMSPIGSDVLRNRVGMVERFDCEQSSLLANIVLRTA